MIKKHLIFYKCFDLIAAILVWLLFYMFRRYVNDFILLPQQNQPLIDPSFPLLLSGLFYASAAMGLHYLSGYYNKEMRPSRIQELVITFIDSFLLSLIVFFVLLLDDTVVSYMLFYKFFILLFAVQFLLTYSERLCITMLYYKKLHRGEIQNNTIILGNGLQAQQAALSMRSKIRDYGTVLKGFVAIDEQLQVDEKEIVGKLDDIEEIVKKLSVQTIVIALDDKNENDLFKLLNRLIPLSLVIRYVPSQLEIITGKVRLVDIDAEPFMSLTTLSMPAWQQSVKRLFDVTTSVAALLILSPLFLFIALKIKLFDSGTVFYKQERIGKYGKPFLIYKFRTMQMDAECKGPQLSSLEDQRITPFGRFLRHYRLDELPQFYNIVRGDMSVVGPRPERQFFIDQISQVAPYYCLIYKIQPGLLSWGPIRVGYTDSLDKMVKRLNYDMVYMENMTLLTDVKIILYSIQVVFSGKGI